MKEFQEILKSKRNYYGNTEAAIEFAAEEYASQFKCSESSKKELCFLCNSPTTISKTSGGLFCINEDCYNYDHPIK